jgi:tetratricopeptide (TPR) repeat protein
MGIRLISSRKISVSLLLVIACAFSACSRSPAAKSAAYIEAGKKLLAKRDPARAILQFRNAVRETPQSADAYYQLSSAFFAVGDLPSGVTNLRKALELNPKYRPAQLQMSQLMSMASDSALVKDAQERLTQMVKEAPDDAEALHALAFADLKLGKPEEAVENLGRAMAIAPRDVMTAVSMSDAKLAQNDLKGAEEVLKKASEDSPKSAEAAFFLGRFYRNQGRFAEAEQEFSRAVSLNPQGSESLYNLAILEDRAGHQQEAEQTLKRLAGLGGALKSIHAVYLFQEGRHDEAIGEMAALLRADPDDRLVRARLVAAQRAAGKPQDAQNTLDSVLKHNPKDSDALLQRAETFIGSRQFEKAEGDLNQVIHLNPDSAAAHYVLAQFHRARGENLTYREELLKALQLDQTLLTVRVEAAQNYLNSRDPRAALALLDQAPAMQKTQISLLAQRNWTLLALGDMEGMRKGVDEGLAKGPNPEFLLQDAMWKLRAGKYSAARGSLEQALQINPTDLRALSALNNSYVAEKQGATALQKVKEYAAREPNSAPVQEFLGVLLAADGDRPQARTAFQAAKAADPRFVRADLSLIQLDIAEGKTDAARQRLKTIVSSDASNTTARLWLGNIEVTNGNQKAALEDFRAVVTAEPGDAQALNNYAYLLAESGGQLTEALKYAQKAKEVSPRVAEYSDTLGWIFYRQGLYSTAVSELERASALPGSHVVTKYHLAMAYAKAGETDRGRAVLKTALKLAPTLPEAKVAQQMLGNRK